MYTINVTQARNDLFDIMGAVLEGGKVMVTSEKGNTVLISEEEWNGLTETLYVLSDPDTLPAVRESRTMPTSELETIDWIKVFSQQSHKG